MNPDDSLILRDVGNFYFEDNDLDKALDYFTKACLIDSEDIHLILHKVKVFVELEKWDEANKCFEDIHKITGDNLEYFIQKEDIFLPKKNIKMQ